MQLRDREQWYEKHGSWPGTRRRACLGVLLLAAILLPARPVIADGADQTVDSHWGPIPVPADSVRAAPAPPATPAWEWPGKVVYKLLGYPLRTGKFTLKKTVVFAHESGLARRLVRLPGPYGPYNIVFSASGGSDGYDVGVSAWRPDFLGTGGFFRAQGQYSTRQAAKASVGYATPGERFALGGRYSSRPQSRYFGLGAGSDEDGESYFTQELAWGGAGIRQPLTGPLDGRLTAVYSEVAARGPADADQHRPLLKAHAAPPGYGERSRGVTLRGGLLHDTTTEEGRPQRGGLVLVEGARFVEASDIGTDFWILRGEAQRFLPLLRSKQTLALRGYATWLAADDLGAIPFQRLLTNDEPDQFRGYRDGRWRDRGIAGATVEYRWPFWAARTADGIGADITLFTDLGQVFREFDEIGDENLTQSYGVGLRLISGRGYGARIEVARSEEEWTVRLKADQLFHLGRRGVHEGRDQVALR